MTLGMLLLTTQHQKCCHDAPADLCSLQVGSFQCMRQRFDCCKLCPCCGPFPFGACTHFNESKALVALTCQMPIISTLMGMYIHCILHAVGMAANSPNRPMWQSCAIPDILSLRRAAETPLLCSTIKWTASKTPFLKVICPPCPALIPAPPPCTSLSLPTSSLSSCAAWLGLQGMPSDLPEQCPLGQWADVLAILAAASATVAAPSEGAASNDAAF